MSLEDDIEDAEGTNSASRAAAPALRHRKELTRRYTVVSAAAAWDVMVKSVDRQADRWIEARNVTYFERRTALFTQLDHWSLVADPGTHSYREVMPAALYGRNMDMVGFFPFQRLLPAPAGGTLGDTELHPTIVSNVKTVTLTTRWYPRSENYKDRT